MFEQLRVRYVLMLFVVMGTLLGTTAMAYDVTFPDPNLETSVRNTLGIPTGPITDTNMETMTSFYASFSNIANIEGLEYATNLTDVYLPSNQISDITVVSGLTNLNDLYLSSNQISDIEAVAGLNNLHYLSLSDNQINDITVVSGLTNMVGLNLSNNQISDIAAVTGLTNLIWLDLWNNQISDIATVAELTNLVGLHLDSNQISDIAAVSGLNNLTMLHLYNNQIVTLNLSNSNLSSLQRFDIGNNPLTSVLLVDATLSQSTFNTLMNGGGYDIGIAEWGGILSLDMSGVDFAEILNLLPMYNMDDLETLLLAGATNLDGDQVVPLTDELNSLNWLDVTGLWNTFDTGTQNSLNTWDAIPGNTLVTGSVPEPATLTMLLTLAGLTLLWRRQR